MLDSNKDQYLYVEKYRPRKIADCILPARLKDILQVYADKKEIPNLLLTGTAGVGKTTVAKALCNEVGCDYMFINGSEERGIDMLRTKIKSYASSMAFEGGRKVIIIDEADYLTPDAQAALRSAIEEFSSNCAFIFTCNFKARLIEPLQSRFANIDFKMQSAEKASAASEFMKRSIAILDAEGVAYEKAAVAQIVTQYFPDFRRVLNELQRLGTNGKVEVGAASVGESKINELIKTLKDKDFPAMRKWVAKNADGDHVRIFRQIFDALDNSLKPESVPQAIVTLADYQYKAAFVADQEVNLVACLVNIMVDCEFQ
jgi:DNA polymerase III delta prime subunit